MIFLVYLGRNLEGSGRLYFILLTLDKLIAEAAFHRYSTKYMFLKMQFTGKKSSQEKTYDGVSFLIKVLPEPAALLRKKLQHSCKIFEDNFFMEHPLATAFVLQRVEQKQGYHPVILKEKIVVIFDSFFYPLFFTLAIQQLKHVHILLIYTKTSILFTEKVNLIEKNTFTFPY